MEIEYAAKVIDQKGKVLGTVDHLVRNSWSGEITKFMVRREEPDEDLFLSLEDVSKADKSEVKLKFSLEELLKREFDGERNVLTIRIESFERRVKEQDAQITKLSNQLEKAYQKVQDIAVKTIEGSSNFKSIASLQQLMQEQTRGQSQEK